MTHLTNLHPVNAIAQIEQVQINICVRTWPQMRSFHWL